MKIDYYKVLGVARDASSEDIRLAWRSLARTHHPDRKHAAGLSDGSSMALLNEAWETLGDPSLREAYDLSCSVPEPRPVQEAVMAAVRAELLASEWKQTVLSSRDLAFERGDLRIAVRLVSTLDSSGLEAWLPFAGVLFGAGEIDCAVLLACRILVGEEAAYRVDAASFPAVAIDLTESTLLGGFPDGAGDLFRSFLVGV